MPSLSLPGQLIWFAHCPKAGGTSIEQFMVASWGDAVGHLHWGWDLWWRDGGWRVADPPNSPQHLVWADAMAQLPHHPDTVFTVVREPIARMASEHRWQRQGRRGTWLGKALARLPFPFWLRLMLATAKRHPHAFDNHFRPQVDFIPASACVFRLEDGLEPVKAWLTKQVGTAPVSCVIPHALPTGGGSDIDVRTQALIALAYADDYDRFGYRRPQTDPFTPSILDWLANCLAPLVEALDRRGGL